MIKKKKQNNNAIIPETPEVSEAFADEITTEAPEEAGASPAGEKKNDTHYLKIFSLFLAVVLWCFVVLNENPNRSIWIRDVEVKIINQNTLAERDLVILKNEPLYIDVRLEGQQNVLSSISAESIDASIDLSTITDTGSIHIPTSIKVNKSGITIAEQKKSGGILEIDAIAETKLSIKPKITGEQAMREGYALSTATVSPAEVVVKGPASLLSSLSAVTEGVDISNKTEGGSIDVSVSILDASGNTVTPIRCEPKKTTLNYTLSVTSQVKIEPTLENAHKLSTRYDVYASATVPDSITVRGDDESMRQLNKMPTEPIDVLALYEGFEKGFLSGTEWNRASFVTTVPAKLAFPEGISAVGTEEISEIEVSITYMNLSSKEDPYQIDSEGFPILLEDEDANESTNEENDN